MYRCMYEKAAELCIDLLSSLSNMHFLWSVSESKLTEYIRSNNGLEEHKNIVIMKNIKSTDHNNIKNIGTYKTHKISGL